MSQRTQFAGIIGAESRPLQWNGAGYSSQTSGLTPILSVKVSRAPTDVRRAGQVSTGRTDDACRAEGTRSARKGQDSFGGRQANVPIAVAQQGAEIGQPRGKFCSGQPAYFRANGRILVAREFLQH